MLFRGQEKRENDHTNWDIERVLECYGWDNRVYSNREWSKTRCPFHYDRTPSAGISIEHNSFRCYGCGAKGNSVTLVMQQEALDAESAVKWLNENVEQASGSNVPASGRGSEPTGHEPKNARRRGKRKQRIPWEPMTLID